MDSYEKADLECLREIADTRHNNERRYYVYDVATDKWFFVGFAHSPYMLMESDTPAKYSNLGLESYRAVKRGIVMYLRLWIRKLDRKLDRWQW